jgi:hypothetical protein
MADSSSRNISKPTPLTAKKARKGADRSANPRRKKVRVDTRTMRQRGRTSSGGSCRDCGQPLTRKSGRYCGACYPQHRADAGASGRAAIAARLATSERRDERRQATKDGIAAVRATQARTAGFDPDAWKRQIFPRLGDVPLKAIAGATGMSVQTASQIRRGVRTPHPRHWAALRALTETSSGAEL